MALVIYILEDYTKLHTITSFPKRLHLMIFKLSISITTFNFCGFFIFFFCCLAMAVFFLYYLALVSFSYSGMIKKASFWGCLCHICTFRGLLDVAVLVFGQRVCYLHNSKLNDCRKFVFSILNLYHMVIQLKFFMKSLGTRMQ